MATAYPTWNIINAILSLADSIRPLRMQTTLTVLPAPAPEVEAAAPKKRLTRAETAAMQDKNEVALREIEEKFNLGHIERRLRMEGLAYHKPWAPNETAEDAALRAKMRIERAKTALWAAQQFQGPVFEALCQLDARTRNALQPKRYDAALLIPHARMGRVRKGKRVNLPLAALPITKTASKVIPEFRNSLPLPKRKGVFFRDTTLRNEVLKGWICQLGQYDTRDTWRAILDAANLAEAYARNDETLELGFKKGGNRVESSVGDRRMPVTEEQLIPAEVQVKLSNGERIDSLDKMLLDLLTETGETEDLTTVQEAAIQQSETFTHSEANEMVPWEIARHIRTAPQTLQDAQTTLQRFPDLTSDDRDEQNALFRLASWVEEQESVQSRMRFYGRAEDPDFKERTFAPVRSTRFAPCLPDFSGFTAILGDHVSDVAVKDQWKLLRTAEAKLAGFFSSEDRIVTTATPGVGSVAALLAKKNDCERQVVNIDANFDETFRSFQRLAMKGLETPPVFVPAAHEGLALVAMMNASRVIIATGLECDTPVHHHGRVTLLPRKYAAALSEAIHFRGANPEVTVIAL